MIGHRGFYRDGWEVVTLHQPLTPFDDAEWELYDLAHRPAPSCATSPPSTPSKLAELAARVGGGGVGQPGLPARRGQRGQVPDPPAAHRGASSEPVTILPGHPDARALAVAAADLVLRACTHHRRRSTSAAGDEGILVAHGDQGGGYGLYVLDGRVPALAMNDGRGHMTVVQRAGPRARRRHVLADLRRPSATSGGSRSSSTARRSATARGRR